MLPAVGTSANEAEAVTLNNDPVKLALPVPVTCNKDAVPVKFALVDFIKPPFAYKSPDAVKWVVAALPNVPVPATVIVPPNEPDPVLVNNGLIVNVPPEIPPDGATVAVNVNVVLVGTETTVQVPFGGLVPEAPDSVICAPATVMP